jgi:hypothetical protein
MSSTGISIFIFNVTVGWNWLVSPFVDLVFQHFELFQIETKLIFVNKVLFAVVDRTDATFSYILLDLFDRHTEVFSGFLNGDIHHNPPRKIPANSIVDKVTGIVFVKLVFRSSGVYSKQS